MANEALTSIFTKYSDFVNIFFSELVSKLSEQNGINDHAIKLVDDQQLSYRPIYSLKPVELEILKTYIETNLANDFIKLSKSLAGAFILFNKKLDGNL